MSSRRRTPSLSALAVLGAAASCSGGSDPSGPGVVVGTVALPVAQAAYHGAGLHRFPGAGVTVDCGSHGGFTGAVAPPTTVGATVVSSYTATFIGELVFEPPAVPSRIVHSLNVPATMAERITLSEIRGATRIFDTELVTFRIEGTGTLAGIIVRQSPAFPSDGVTSITVESSGRSRVESHYDVWLEVSLDQGRSWHPAEQAVRMTLQPT